MIFPEIAAPEPIGPRIPLLVILVDFKITLPFVVRVPDCTFNKPVTVMLLPIGTVTPVLFETVRLLNVPLPIIVWAVEPANTTVPVPLMLPLMVSGTFPVIVNVPLLIKVTPVFTISLEHLIEESSVRLALTIAICVESGAPALQVVPFHIVLDEGVAVFVVRVAPVPAIFLAATVKVYVLPLVKPLKVYGFAVIPVLTILLPDDGMAVIV